MRSRPEPRSTQTAAGAADEDVGGARIAQQLVERAGADELLAEDAQRGQHVEVGGDPAGLGADRGGDRAGVVLAPPAASRERTRSTSGCGRLGRSEWSQR